MLITKHFDTQSLLSSALDIIINNISSGDIKNMEMNELQFVSAEYLIRHISPYDLLLMWYKLPSEHAQNFLLQSHLPCFIHYNRPNQEVHIDGPVPSQANCRFCAINSVNV